MQSEPRFQILSIDGGGIKGIFAAAVLAAIEKDLGTNVSEHFDLIAGTSTGGIIALGLGLGLRPREIVQFYADYGDKIFPRTYGFRTPMSWIGRKYSAAPLESALRECFKEKLFGDSAKRLVIPSFNLGEDDVYLFRTAHHERLRRDYRVEAWKVARATSAAPTYFASCRHVDGLRLVDGGVWANNPTMVAVIEALETLSVPREALRVFSLGTSDPIGERPRRLDWGGRIPWAAGAQAVEVIMRGQSLAATNHAGLLLGREHVYRLNPPVPSGAFMLDGAERAADLMAKAAHVSRKETPAIASLFMPHHAAPFTPVYKP